MKKNRVCPYNGEEFEQKRTNQVYASRYNQIMFNNNKNRELQREIKEVNKKLLKNRRILSELLNDKKEKTFKIITAGGFTIGGIYILGKVFKILAIAKTNYTLLKNSFKQQN